MIDILKFIYGHPLNKNNKLNAILRFIRWQISSRLLGSGAFVYNWINDSKLIISKGMTGATGNIYVGLMEYEDMSFLLHYLKKDDLFYDIGANVGVYTILASKVKGAKSVSIEPLPRTYEKLIDNIKINRLDNVNYKNIGLSFEKSKLYFTTNKDTMNSVALDTDKCITEVPVDTLDNISNEFGIPTLIKIDVEGYETNVLLGGKKVLQDESLEVIILELNGSGEKFGFMDDDIHKNLLKLGFESCSYNPFKREIIKLNKYGVHNTIYIRSTYLDKISKILKSSDGFNLNGIII